MMAGRSGSEVQIPRSEGLSSRTGFARQWVVGEGMVGWRRVREGQAYVLPRSAWSPGNQKVP